MDISLDSRLIDFLDELREAHSAAVTALAKATGGQVLDPLERRLVEHHDQLTTLIAGLDAQDAGDAPASEGGIEPAPEERQQEADNG